MNQAGVVVLIEKQSNSLILTVRNKSMRNHPGEICFAGGRQHKEDDNLYVTALRELHEELGIESERVKLIRKMRSELTLTGYLIQPWLTSITDINPYTPNQHEVEEVLLVPLEEACRRSNYRPLEVVRYGKRLITVSFQSKYGMIWGATARIMRQLCVS